MITLYQFLKIMDYDCELRIYNDDTLDFILGGDNKGNIDLPYNLYDVPVVKFIPGIVTMIYVKEN